MRKKGSNLTNQQRVKSEKKKWKKFQQHPSFRKRRDEFVGYLVSQKIPNWNLRITVDKSLAA